MIRIELCHRATDTGWHMKDSVNPGPAKARYVWPWIVAGAVLLGIVLSVLGIRHEAQRVRDQRQMQMPSSGQ